MPSSPPEGKSYGYHLTDIPRGQFGELSKIREELDELQDAQDQGAKIMELVELSDLICAVRGYLENYHPGITLEDPYQDVRHHTQGV